MAGPPKVKPASTSWEGLANRVFFFFLLGPCCDRDCPSFLWVLCSMIRREQLQESQDTANVIGLLLPFQVYRYFVRIYKIEKSKNKHVKILIANEYNEVPKQI